ncbi:alanine--tRNA ligase-related protein [Halopiger thermotolerans]
MSGQRAAAEPYATRFETDVTAIDGRKVWLERSHFYGASGGQPADRGTIGDAEVVDVRLVDGEQVHELAAEPSFRTGRSVLCSIDWSFRMYCMRAHTAGHVLYGAARRLLEDASYAGFEIGDDRETIRLDLETRSTVDDETLLELDRLVNRTVWESRSVSWDDVPIAEARERDDVTFGEATEDDAVQKGRVRLVTIGSKDENGSANGSSRLRGGFTVGSGGEPWDVSACGGTHVRNTREIGPVTVIDGSSPDDETTRIELAVGPRAIEHRTAEKRAAFAATRTLEAGVEAVPDELERVVGDGPDRRRPVRRDGGGTGDAE